MNCVVEFGADPTGTVDSTTAIQAALDMGGLVYFPEGRYLVTGTLDVTVHHTQVRGAGDFLSRIVFKPNVTASCFHFESLDAYPLGYCSIRDMGFESTTNKDVIKTAIEAVDVTTFTVRDVVIAPWLGDGSTGLLLRGRDHGTVEKIKIRAQRPIVIGVNPKEEAKDLDHFRFLGCYLLVDSASQLPAVEFEPGTTALNVTFQDQAWVGGGLKWVTTEPNSSSGISISNVRTEQMRDPAAFSVEVDHGAYLQDLLLTNCRFAVTNPGVRLRHIRRASLLHCVHGGTETHVESEDVLSLDQVQCSWSP